MKPTDFPEATMVLGAPLDHVPNEDAGAVVSALGGYESVSATIFLHSKLPQRIAMGDIVRGLERAGYALSNVRAKHHSYEARMVLVLASGSEVSLCVDACDNDLLNATRRVKATACGRS